MKRIGYVFRFTSPLTPEVEVQLHTFLTSAQDGGEWSSSCPGRFIHSGSGHYPLDTRLGGPQIRSQPVDKRKSLACAWNRTTIPRAYTP
jgi:hypothetical protein